MINDTLRASTRQLLSGFYMYFVAPSNAVFKFDFLPFDIPGYPFDWRTPYMLYECQSCAYPS